MKSKFERRATRVEMGQTSPNFSKGFPWDRPTVPPGFYRAAYGLVYAKGYGPVRHYPVNHETGILPIGGE